LDPVYGINCTALTELDPCSSTLLYATTPAGGGFKVVTKVFALVAPLYNCKYEVQFDKLLLLKVKLEGHCAEAVNCKKQIAIKKNIILLFILK
jgi:hypothetical protein